MATPAPITPVPTKQLGPLLVAHLSALTASLVPAGDSFDPVRGEYLHSFLLETLVAHVAAAARKTPTQLTQLESACADEMVDQLAANLEDELDGAFATAKEDKATLAQARLRLFVREAMDLAYGRATAAPAAPAAATTKTDARKSTGTSATPSNATASAPPGFAQPTPAAASLPAAAGSTSSLPSPTSRCDPLVLILHEIFPALPPAQVDAVFVACGGNLDAPSALDVAGAILAQCLPGACDSAREAKSPDDLDAWPVVLQALGADQRQAYKQHLQAHKYEQSRSGVRAADSTRSASDTPTSQSAGQQFFYDQPESSLVGLKRQTSSSSTASASSSTSATGGVSARADAYYSSAEFLALKKHLVDQFTYDSSKAGTFHRPHVKFESRPKHHARYLDGRIVNTKGEKHTIIVDPEEEARAAAWKATHKPLKIIHTKKAGGKGHKII